MLQSTRFSSKNLPSFANLARSSVQFARKNLFRTITNMIVAGLIAWFLNLVVIIFLYDGYNAPGPLASMTGNGSMVHGVALWSVIGAMLGAVFGYWRRVGTRKFVANIAGFPKMIGSFLASDGRKARPHLLAGAAAAMIGSVLLSNGFTLVLGIGLLVGVPSVIGRILANFLQGLTQRVLKPSSNQSQAATLPPIFVAIIGAGTGLFLSGLALSATTRLIIGILCAVAAYFLLKRDGPSSALTIFLLSLITVVLYELLYPAIAFADDTGWREQGGSLSGLLSSPTLPQTIGYGAAGGAAAAAGAGPGSGLGELIGAGDELTPEEIDELDDDELDELFEDWVDEIDEEMEEESAEEESYDPESGDPLPPGWVDDSRVISGQDAIDILIDEGAVPVPGRPGCIEASSMPRLNRRLQGYAHGGGATICSDEVAVIERWPHPGGEPETVELGGDNGDMSQPGDPSRLADQLRDHGIEPEIITDKDGNQHVALPENMPPHIAGFGHGTRTVVDENGNERTVVDSGVVIWEWDDEPPPEEEEEIEAEEEESEEEIPEEEEEEPPVEVPEEEDEDKPLREAMLEVRLAKQGFQQRVYFGRITQQISRIEARYHTPGDVKTQLAQATSSDDRGRNSRNLAHVGYEALLDGQPFASGTGSGSVSLALPSDFSSGGETLSIDLGTVLTGETRANVQNFIHVTNSFERSVGNNSTFRGVIRNLEKYPDQWLPHLIQGDAQQARQAINALNLLRYFVGITRMGRNNIQAHWRLFTLTVNELLGAVVGVIAIPFMLTRLIGAATFLPLKAWNVLPQAVRTGIVTLFSTVRRGMGKGLIYISQKMSEQLRIDPQTFEFVMKGMLDDVDEHVPKLLNNFSTTIQRMATRIVGMVVRFVGAMLRRPTLLKNIGSLLLYMPILTPGAKKAAEETLKWTIGKLEGVGLDLEHLGDRLMTDPSSPADGNSIIGRFQQAAAQGLHDIDAEFANYLQLAIARATGLQVSAQDWHVTTNHVSHQLREINRNFQNQQELENYVVELSENVRFFIEVLSVLIIAPIYLLNRAFGTAIKMLSRVGKLFGLNLPATIALPQFNFKAILDLLDLLIIKTGIMVRQIYLLIQERARIAHVYEQLFR